MSSIHDNNCVPLTLAESSQLADLLHVLTPLVDTLNLTPGDLAVVKASLAGLQKVPLKDPRPLLTGGEAQLLYQYFNRAANEAMRNRAARAWVESAEDGERKYKQLVMVLGAIE